MSTFRIDTAAGRQKLKVRGAPYFVKLDKGRSLGYRKGKTGGSWLARIIKPGEKPLYHTLTVDADDPQKEYGVALQRAQERFKQQDQGVKVDYLLKDAMTDYLLYLEAEKSDAVFKTSAAVLNGIPERMKKTPVHELTTRQLDAWRKSFMKKSEDAEVVRRSKNTCNRRWSDLRACLNKAFKNGYVADRTAWERVEPFKKAQRGRQIFWTPEEAGELLTAAMKENTPLYNLLYAALLTGCRVGELRFLTVRDFDKANQLVNIGTSKTGHRVVFLSDQAHGFLKEMSKSKHPSAWLLDYNGRQWPEDYHHKMFRELRSKVNIDQESTFYCARHYYISKALESGVSVELVAKNCGTSPAMIYKFYGKFTKQEQKSAANRVDLAIGGN